MMPHMGSGTGSAMGPGMMNGIGPWMPFWIILAIVIALALIALGARLVMSLRKRQGTFPMQHGPQPQDAYQAYEQGYQAQQQPSETYQEGEQHYPYPQSQNEQPQAEYPKIMAMKH